MLRFVYCSDTGEWSDRECRECNGFHEVIEIPEDQARDKILIMLKAIRSAYWGLGEGSLDVMGDLCDCWREVAKTEIDD